MKKSSLNARQNNNNNPENGLVSIPLARYNYLKAKERNAKWLQTYPSMMEASILEGKSVNAIFAISLNNPLEMRSFNGFVQSNAAHPNSGNFVSYFIYNSLDYASIVSQYATQNIKESTYEKYPFTKEEDVEHDLNGLDSYYNYKLISGELQRPEINIYTPYGGTCQFQICNFSDYTLITLPVVKPEEAVDQDEFFHTELIPSGNYDLVYTQMYVTIFSSLRASEKKKLFSDRFKYLRELILMNKFVVDVDMKSLMAIDNTLRSWHIPYDSRLDNIKKAIEIIQSNIIPHIQADIKRRNITEDQSNLIMTDINIYIEHYPSIYGYFIN